MRHVTKKSHPHRKSLGKYFKGTAENIVSIHLAEIPELNLKPKSNNCYITFYHRPYKIALCESKCYQIWRINVSLAHIKARHSLHLENCIVLSPPHVKMEHWLHISARQSLKKLSCRVNCQFSLGSQKVCVGTGCRCRRSLSALWLSGIGTGRAHALHAGQIQK